MCCGVVYVEQLLLGACKSAHFAWNKFHNIKPASEVGLSGSAAVEWLVRRSGGFYAVC